MGNPQAKDSLESGYKVDTLSMTKFERDYKRSSVCLQYDFINAFPKGMTAIPVSYGAADLVKVTVTFAYDRYVLVPASKPKGTGEEPLSPKTQVKQSPKPINKADGKSKTQNKYGDIGKGLDAPVTEAERNNVRRAVREAARTDGISRY